MAVSKITSPISPNEQANKINEIIDSLSSSSITVDSALSTTSTNPVQNKVVTAALNNKQGTISDLSTIRSGASAGATAVQPGDLANVATSGSYNDLSNKPTIPSVGNGTLTLQKNGSTVKTFTANSSSNVTANITVPTKTSELTNDSGYTTNTGTVTSVNNVSPVNGNVTLSIPAAQIQSDWSQTNTSSKDYIKNKPTIPSVGNGTITIKQGGATKGTFTTNQSGNTTISLDGGGGTATDVQINGTSIVSNNVANIVTNTAYNASSNKIATMSDVYSRNIGEIIQSTIPLSDAGLHLLDGSTILNAGIYEDFFTKIQQLYNSGNYDYLFTTASDWQTSVETYGVCGKFVYSAGLQSLRLPKITGFTEGTTDVNTLGDLTEAGLPNIIGSATGNRMANITDMDGAFSVTGRSSTKNFANGEDSSSKLNGFDFNASRSSTIYGNSTTVQPQSIKVLYYIVVANTIKTEIEVDIDEIATDLNGKADRDLANLSSTSSANFDGQPTFKYALLVESKVTVNTSTNLKSTGYLPNDNYRYEVFVGNLLRSTSTIYSSIGNVASPATNTTAGVICKCRTASNSIYSYNQCWIPLDTDGVIYYQTSGSPSTGITFDILAYRRIGTNT